MKISTHFFKKPNVHIISKFSFPRAEKQILLGTTCVTQNTFAKSHRASVFTKSILMFSMYVCAVNNSLLPPLCVYVFFSTLLAPLKPSLQIFSHTALER